MTDEYEEYLRIKAIIDEQIRLLAENPKLKGKTDAQLWGNELRSRATKAQMDDPEFRQKWQESQKVGAQKRVDSVEWHKNRNLALQKVYDTAEWQENVTIANQKKADSAEWRANQKVGAQKRVDSVEWREKHKAGCQKTCKKISCDGVIYPSQTEAYIALSPVTRLTTSSKRKWLNNQMKKYPDRYFYIDEEAK